MADNIVTSVNGQTGEIELTRSDFGLQQETWTCTFLDKTVEEQQVVVYQTPIRLIYFTIYNDTTKENVIYQAEAGMTWEDYCDSSLNTPPDFRAAAGTLTYYYWNNNTLEDVFVPVFYDSAHLRVVRPTDIIVEQTYYVS